MLLFLSCMVANGGIAVAVCIVEVVWEGGGGKLYILYIWVEEIWIYSGV